MQYVISFLEGIVSFLSPCLLPMLPMYVFYFAGGGERSNKKTLKTAFGFLLGFTLVFAAMGTLGSFLTRYRRILHIAGGLIVILFGLNDMGLLRLNLFRGTGRTPEKDCLDFFSGLVFGLVFCVGWIPCAGDFLGAELMSQTLEGMGMLLSFSLGLGVPFLFSAVLIDRLKGAFSRVGAHYRQINLICGGLLVLLGILMATGTLGSLMSAAGL